MKLLAYYEWVVDSATWIASGIAGVLARAVTTARIIRAIVVVVPSIERGSFVFFFFGQLLR